MKKLFVFCANNRPHRPKHERYYQKDWYVDSVNGNNFYSGKSAGEPLRTIAALLTKPIMEGDEIGFKRGSHWREQLTLPCANLDIDAYGRGVDPVFDGSDIVTGWSKTGGQTYVYEKSVVCAGSSGEQRINCWEDGIHLARASSVANCDATANSIYVAAEFGTITVYIHPSDDGNPNTNGKTYEVSTRNFGISADFTGIKIRHVTTQKSQSCSGSLIVGRSCLIEDVSCLDGSKHNLYYKDGCVLTRVLAKRGHHETQGNSLFVYNENTPLGLGIIHNACVGDNDYIGSGGAFYGHKNTSGTFGTIIWNNCVVKNCFSGYSPLDCEAVLNNCQSEATCTIAVRPLANIILNDCDLISADYVIEPLASGITITVNGGSLTVPNPGASKNLIVISAPYSNVTLIMDDVIISNDSLPYPITLINYAADLTLDIQNCTWTKKGLNVYQFVNSTGLNIVSDYNAFVAVSGWYIGPTTYTFVQWQALGYDQHSIHV